jgi:hypothetical protein
MLLEEKFWDIPNRMQKQFFKQLLKKKWQVLETEIDIFWLNISYHLSLAC